MLTAGKETMQALIRPRVELSRVRQGVVNVRHNTDVQPCSYPTLSFTFLGGGTGSEGFQAHAVRAVVLKPGLCEKPQEPPEAQPEDRPHPTAGGNISRF